MNNMTKTNFLRNVAAIAVCLAAMTACNSGGKKDAAQTSSEEPVAEVQTVETAIAATPAEFLSRFGVAEADVKPSDANDGTLELAPNDPNHGEIVYKSAKLKDVAEREKYINALLDKARSLATDGKLYTSVSTKEEFQFKEGSYAAVCQYYYEDKYVTFNVMCMDGQVKVGFWK
jgi:plasmid stabilization system protein ParE